VRILLDVDGVVADLVGGVLKFLDCQLPPERGDAAYDIAATLGYRFGNKAFWDHFNYDFWAGLPRTAEADEVVELACRYAGKENVSFSTHPTETYGCAEGKLAWLRRWYPELPVLLHCGAEVRKDLLAAPQTLLIDDRSHNVDTFRAAGGMAFLFARPWNRDWEIEGSNVPRLAAFLESFVTTLGRNLLGDNFL
jgi:5'(3')-deoxyribonucleotidase